MSADLDTTCLDFRIDSATLLVPKQTPFGRAVTLGRRGKRGRGRCGTGGVRGFRGKHITPSTVNPHSFDSSEHREAGSLPGRAPLRCRKARLRPEGIG